MKNDEPLYKTREEWLLAAASAMAPWITAHYPDFRLPRVSIGWAPRTGKAIGWCIPGAATRDGRRQVFISPELDPHEVAGCNGVLATLLHEMAHAALPDEEGHGKTFGKLCRELGFDPPWTMTPATPGLIARLERIAEDLGPFPHAAIDLSKQSKQTTRLLRVECRTCGYICRTTQQWLVTGAPICPCNNEPMATDDDDE